MSKIKWHYAVVKSIFGNFWVGKTKLPLKKEIIYETFQEALEKALWLFETHNDFVPDEDDNSELAMSYEDLQDTQEKDVEKISKKIEKFIR